MTNNMTYDDDLLSAFLDGELPPEKMTEISDACADNPALRLRIENLRQATRLGAHYLKSIDDRPLPDALLNLISPQIPRPANDMTPTSISFWPTAIAASLALMVGLLAGKGLLAPQTTQSDNMLLASTLETNFADALNTTPSNNATILANYQASLTPLVSFQNKEGAFCREFIVETTQQTKQAVACKTDNQWQLQIIVATNVLSNNPAGYQTAAAHSSASLDYFIQNTMAEAPLDAEQEQVAIAEGWQAK